MKLIPIFILAFIIFSCISLAQQEEVTTISNPEQLRTIFEFRQNGTAPVELYSTIRGREISLGDVSGAILVEPPLNIRIRNGKYYLVTEEISIAVYGDMRISKPMQEQKYPIITLLNGTIISQDMEFSCGMECDKIIIEGDTGYTEIKGNATIHKKESMLFEEDLIPAINLKLKPLQPEMDELLLHFNVSGINSQTQTSRLGGFDLAPGSEGHYSLRKIIRPITRQLTYQETISGNVHILTLEQPLEKCLVQKERNEIQGDLANHRFIKLKSGTICYTNLESLINFYSGITPQNGGMMLDKETGLLTLSLKNKTILAIDSGNPLLSKIEVLPFLQDDLESKMIVENEAIGNRKIIFSRDNIIADGNWQDFGISFKAHIFSPQERRYDLLECKYEESKCYLNGMEIISNSTTITSNLGKCRQNSDCNRNTICESERCIEPRTCRTIIEDNNNDPIAANTIDVLFVGDGITNSNELEQIVRSLITGTDGLFNTEPFISNRDKFRILINTAVPSTVSRQNWPELESLDISNCPNAEVKIILSRRPFISSSSIERGLCRISLRGINERDKITLLHEFGHCFGKLSDEYYYKVEGRQGRAMFPNCIRPANGKTAQDIAKEEWARILLLQPGITRQESISEAERLAD